MRGVITKPLDFIIKKMELKLVGIEFHEFIKFHDVKLYGLDPHSFIVSNKSYYESPSCTQSPNIKGA